MPEHVSSFQCLPPKSPGQKMSGSHPEFDRSKGVLYHKDQLTDATKGALLSHFSESI